MKCLLTGCEELLGFNYSAEHWRRLHTTNPVQSVCVCDAVAADGEGGTSLLSRKTVLALVPQLVLSAQHKWDRLNGCQRLALLIKGLQLRYGNQEVQHVYVLCDCFFGHNPERLPSFCAFPQ